MGHRNRITEFWEDLVTPREPSNDNGERILGHQENQVVSVGGRIYTERKE